MFLHTTDVDSLPRQSLINFHLFIFRFQVTHIPGGNPAFYNLFSILFLILFLVFFVFFVLIGVCIFTMRAAPCFLCPRGSQAWDINCISSRMTTGTTSGSEFNLAIKTGAKVCWSGCPAWPPPDLKVQRKPGISVGAPPASRFQEGCCHPTTGVWNWNFPSPRWATLLGWWAPSVHLVEKILFDGIVHEEFVSVPEQAHTAVGQAYHLTSWFSSTWPHCCVSYNILVITRFKIFYCINSTTQMAVLFWQKQVYSLTPT